MFVEVSNVRNSQQDYRLTKPSLCFTLCLFSRSSLPLRLGGPALHGVPNHADAQHLHGVPIPRRVPGHWDGLVARDESMVRPLPPEVPDLRQLLPCVSRLARRHERCRWRRLRVCRFGASSRFHIHLDRCIIVGFLTRMVSSCVDHTLTWLTGGLLVLQAKAKKNDARRIRTSALTTRPSRRW